MPMSKKYRDQTYGNHLQWHKDQSKVHEEYASQDKFYKPFVRHGLFHVVEEEVQVERKRIEIDFDNLPFDKKMAMYLKEFCFSTSAHGIPMIGQSTTTPQRVMWTMLFLTSFSIYWYQITQVMEQYNLMEKIVDIQLVFEAPPFPAITLCNLNPYRKSQAETVPLVAKMLKTFDDVLKQAGDNKKKQDDKDKHSRMKRGHGVLFEAAQSVCACAEKNSACEADKVKYPEDGDQLCICAFDRHSGDAWPCYPENAWGDITICMSCNDENVCNKDASSQLGTIEMDCVCQSIDTFCIARDDGHDMLNLWEYYGNIAPTEDPSFLEALGFAGMTDEVAIVTKAKENIVFAMASLPMEKREDLSMPKEVFVQKCSFNSKQCDITKDFATKVDPIFGNCYTFNFNRLRMIVYVNASDYLPTTEAAGVKLTIHEKDQVPFPDLAGYNAPVGYTSSFGIKKKRTSRLPAPYGDCRSQGPSSSFVYEGYAYSTEGCRRSCFQSLVLHHCDCGDPRFPVQRKKGQHHCEAIDPSRCLEKYSKDDDDEDKMNTGVKRKAKCNCPQPCDDSAFMVSYSAAQWPSPSLQMQLGLCEGSQEYCIQYYRDNGAMLEVFFEQLNYEQLSESPAYGFTNLLADFGGQFGLWLGVSVITICEFLFLVLQVTYMIGKEQYKLYKKKQAEIAGKKAAEEMAM